MKHRSYETDDFTLTALTRAAGLSIAPGRLGALAPTADRLFRAGEWVSAQDLGWVEPATIFDAQVKEPCDAGE